MSRDWQHGLFSCFEAGSDCLIACCCPCITYGKTNHRLKHPHDAHMAEYSTFNGPCVVFCLVTEFTAGIGGCIMQMLQRAEVRGAGNIKGSTGSDAAIACCCHCCSLIQDVQETKSIVEHTGQYAAAVPVQPGYQQPMAYAQPPHAHGQAHPPPPGQTV